MTAEPADFEFDEGYPPDVECAICFLPWAGPCELRDCGHIFCAACCRPCRVCPVCRGAIRARAEPNRALRNIVAALRGRCTRCGWQGTREDFTRHVLAPCLPIAAPQGDVDTTLGHGTALRLHFSTEPAVENAGAWLSVTVTLLHHARDIVDPHPEHALLPPHTTLEQLLGRCSRALGGALSAGADSPCVGAAVVTSDGVHTAAPVGAAEQPLVHCGVRSGSTVYIVLRLQASDEVVEVTRVQSAKDEVERALRCNASLLPGPATRVDEQCVALHHRLEHLFGTTSNPPVRVACRRLQAQLQECRCLVSLKTQRASAGVVADDVLPLESGDVAPWVMYNLPQALYADIEAFFARSADGRTACPTLDASGVRRLCQWLNLSSGEVFIRSLFDLFQHDVAAGRVGLREFCIWVHGRQRLPQHEYGVTFAAYDVALARFRRLDVNQRGALPLTAAIDFVREYTGMTHVPASGIVRRAVDRGGTLQEVQFHDLMQVLRDDPEHRAASQGAAAAPPPSRPQGWFSHEAAGEAAHHVVAGLRQLLGTRAPASAPVARRASGPTPAPHFGASLLPGQEGSPPRER